MVVGALLQCTAFHLHELIVGRLVTGFGLISACSLQPSDAWPFPLAFQIFVAAIILAFVLLLPDLHTEFTAIKATIVEMAKGSFHGMFTMDEDRC
ncbi:hypothetical protein EYZ11_003795 [Aspergillus tanneri]|uniref:Major facilitator superfamily (MFS) profile domain-containing protein n=1 Tax=Aspergillus tanneri TaxID=1220188 RepID=A0A4S3JPH8_9EURO|nr:hypothetical protein EYZ11_003795 [Aspergillus tanneri]